MIDDEHRAQWDAETLAEAKTIESDPNRLNAAKQAAGKMAKEQEERANNMKKVSGSKKGTNKAAPQHNGITQNRTLKPQPVNTNNGYNVFQRI
jgi:hypothetical protein